MDRLNIPPAARAAGVREQQARAPEVVTGDWLAQQNGQLERVLRLQYRSSGPRAPGAPPEQKPPFPPEWEAELASLEGEDTTRRLQRWAFLKHCYLVRSGASVSQGADVREKAARKLIRREPIVVSLAGHRVAITGRSYSAMAEIAVHDLRIQQLNSDLDHTTALRSELQRQLRKLPLWKLRDRRVLRRRVRWVVNITSRLLVEREKHRHALYAHALTKDGGPADVDAPDAVPAWWRELGPEDDGLLLFTLVRVGLMRYKQLGPQPPLDREHTRGPHEALGFANLLSAWDSSARMDPADLYDTDLGQLLTSMRAAAREPLRPDG